MQGEDVGARHGDTVRAGHGEGVNPRVPVFPLSLSAFSADSAVNKYGLRMLRTL
jgi:hypothetical protein